MEQQNENVNYNELFIIKKDEFDGHMYVELRHGMRGNPALCQYCDDIDAAKPEITISVCGKGDDFAISLNFDMSDLLKKIEEVKVRARSGNISENIRALKNLNNPYYDRLIVDMGINSPTRGIIIVVDGAESIKLNADSENTPGDSLFFIDKELFLKLCNAHDLEFRIFKEAGSSAIVIHGTKEKEANLISQFQILYNYVIDKNMFSDAVQRFAIKQKQKSEMARRMAPENSKGNRDLAIGIPLGVIGGPISLLIAETELISNGTCYTFLITIPLLFIGIMLIIFGARRKSGKMIKRY